MHTLLHTIIDFLIALSSASGVLRNTSPANFAERCTFQDAFSQFPRVYYQQSISSNLGLMRTVSIVAEKKALQIKSEICHELTAKEESIMGIVLFAELTNGDEATSLEPLHLSPPIYFNMTCTNADEIASEQDLKSAVQFCRQLRVMTSPPLW